MHLSKDLWRLRKDFCLKFFAIFTAMRKLFKPTWALGQRTNGLINEHLKISSGNCRLYISPVVDFKGEKEIGQINLKVVEW